MSRNGKEKSNFMMDENSARILHGIMISLESRYEYAYLSPFDVLPLTADCQYIVHYLHDSLI